MTTAKEHDDNYTTITWMGSNPIDFGIKAMTTFEFGDVTIHAAKKANFLLKWWCKLLGITVEDLK